MNLDELIPEEPQRPPYIPEVNPPSIRDLQAVDFNKYDIDVFMSCQDPCPTCGAHNMSAGDYIYLGSCLRCYNDEC